MECAVGKLDMRNHASDPMVTSDRKTHANLPLGALIRITTQPLRSQPQMRHTPKLPQRGVASDRIINKRIQTADRAIPHKDLVIPVCRPAVFSGDPSSAFRQQTVSEIQESRPGC